MGQYRKVQDRGVLRLKLQTVERLISRYEELVEQFEGEICVLKDNPVLDGEMVLERVNRFMSRLMQVGVGKSLVQDELSQVSVELAHDLVQNIGKVTSRLNTRLARLSTLRRRTDDPRFVREAAGYAGDWIRLITEALAPAYRVRQELIESLNRRSGITTSRQMAKKLRNDRIKHLAALHNTASPAELERIATEDPVIQAIGEPISRETIRNVLKPRKNRGKKSSP